MKHRTFRALALAAAAAVAMTGCANGGDAGQGGDDSISIALVSKGFQHQFWQAVNQGAEKAAAELGITVTFEGPDSESNVEQQIQQLPSAIDRQPDAIGFAALDSQAAAPLLQQAQAANIPVVAFDSGVDSDIPVTTAATDNVAAAEEAAKHMVELTGGQGKIGVVAHDQTSQTGVQRRDGFLDYIKANAPGLEVVDVQYGGDPAVAADVADAMLQANPDLVGLYGTNEGAAVGIANAVSELGKAGQLQVIGFDSGGAQRKAIRDGIVTGAITQNPVGIGYETVMAAYKAIQGEELPKTIDTGFFWYDKTNIDDPEIAAVLYE